MMRAYFSGNIVIAFSVLVKLAPDIYLNCKYMGQIGIQTLRVLLHQQVI